MGTRFIAVPADESVVTDLSALYPANPFATTEFFLSKRQAGYAGWVTGLSGDAGGLECGCGAFLKKGILNRTLNIPSLPAVDAASPFWVGLREFCLQLGVTRLVLGTFGSPPKVEIPVLDNQCTQRDRCEFVIKFDGDRPVRLGSNHKRNLKKAQKTGVTLKQTRSVEALTAHQVLMNQSMDRRRSRGENVKRLNPSPENLALIQSGAGELFQALRGTTLLSSVLVLRASEGAYYESAGTTPEGMAVGASHYLIYSIVNQLRRDGAKSFNLGGADEGSGLARFKEGFGASPIFLPSAICYVGPSWRRRVSRAIELVRSDRQALLRLLTGGVSRLVVYAADPDTVPRPVPQAGLTLRALTADDLRTLTVADASFRARQLDRLSRFGASYAYAVLADGKIAHISWLLPQAAIERDSPQVFRPQASDAEITCSETLPEFRERRIFTFALSNLLAVARTQGIRRVLAKTNHRASHAANKRAGMVRVGSIFLVTMPVIQRLLVWRRY